MQTTANYGLKKPEGNDTVDIDVINGNMDMVDAELNKKASVSDIPTVPSSLPANGGNADTVDGKHSSEFINIGTNGAVTLRDTTTSRPNGTVTEGIGLLQLRRNGTYNYAWDEGADFKVKHGGPDQFGTNLELWLNGVSNTNGIPDQKVTTFKYDGGMNINGAVNYAVTANSNNDYSATILNLTALTDGLQVRVKFNSASTGVTTLNINGLGAKSIVDYFGNAVTNIRQNLIANLCYEATSRNFILQGKGGGGNATSADLLIGKTATTDGGQIIGTATLESLGGKNFYSGTVTTDSNGYASKNNLPFTPSLVVITNLNSLRGAILSSNPLFQAQANSNVYAYSMYTFSMNGMYISIYSQIINNGFVTSGSSYLRPNATYNFIAYE